MNSTFKHYSEFYKKTLLNDVIPFWEKFSIDKENGGYAQASGDEESFERALKTYHNIKARQNNPKGKYEKTTGNRPMKNFALPMIMSNLILLSGTLGIFGFSHSILPG